MVRGEWRVDSPSPLAALERAGIAQSAERPRRRRGALLGVAAIVITIAGLTLLFIR